MSGRGCVCRSADERPWHKTVQVPNKQKERGTQQPKLIEFKQRPEQTLALKKMPRGTHTQICMICMCDTGIHTPATWWRNMHEKSRKRGKTSRHDMHQPPTGTGWEEGRAHGDASRLCKGGRIAWWGIDIHTHAAAAAALKVQDSYDMMTT